MKILRIAICAGFIGIVLNVLLSLLLSPFATKSQIKPPKGAANLPFISQIMHMLVHHKQVLLTSSLIVAILVFISTYLSLLYC